MPPPFSSLAHRSIPDVCTTSNCVQAAEFIMSYVNLNIDPCSDFFQYTCGNWILSDSIKNIETGYGSLSVTRASNIANIIELLDGSFEDLHQTIQTIDPAYHTQDKIDIDRNNFQIVKDYYEKCQDTEFNKNLGFTPLFSYLGEIENDLFPITEKIVPENLARIMAASLLREIQVIMGIKPNQNNLNNTFNIFSLYLPFANSGTDYESLESLDKYKKTIMYYLSIVIGEPTETTDDYGELVLQESQKSNFTLWSESKIEKATNRFIDFEMRLSKALDLLEPINRETIVPGTLKELESINPTIEWSKLVTTLVSSEYATPTLPIAFQNKSMEMIEEILLTTSVETLQEYFIIETAIQTSKEIFFTDNVNIPDNIQSFKNAFKEPNSKEPEPMKEQCASDISLKFNNIIGRFFTLRTLGATEELHSVQEMANNIYSSLLHDKLPKVSWLDKETKTKVIQKIEALKMSIGIKTTNPDWRDPSSLQDFYKGLDIDNQSSHYENILNFYIWKNDKLFKSMEKKRVDMKWDDESNDPSSVNALYNPLTNSAQILIDIIQKPMYSAGNPKYLNYGALGVVIGHEFMHSLDNLGKNYNATGYYGDWFSEPAIKTFNEKAQCYIDQFNNFNLTGPNESQFPLNGEIALGENMADEGGLSIAFHSYQKNIYENGPELLLPGFEKFTSEQMFFISHGLSDCAIIPKNKAEDLAEEVHSPWYYRTIGGMQNSVEFSKAFNCPVGSPMNPTKKCSVW